MTTDRVVIVGAGLAGLSCALRLHEAGVAFEVFEAADGVGGRVRTNAVEGFRLDRGFQVLLDAYPECRRVLDYRALDLRSFEPGALIRKGGKFHRIADPWRRPGAILETLRAGVGSLGDKLRIGTLRGRVTRPSLERLFRQPERTTLEHLRKAGFSEGMIDAFFRPFFGGIFLDRTLAASSRMFDFVFRMLSLGGTSLPAHGMSAIPEQLAARLPNGSVQTGRRIASITPTEVVLESGERRPARAVVVATEGPEAARLVDGLPAPGSREVTCLYFAAERPPVSQPVLVLNGEGKGPVNNLCVPSAVAPAYAPAGKSLVSVTVLEAGGRDDTSLEAEVRRQLEGWFGEAVHDWRHLRTYHIAHALPDQTPPALEPPERAIKLESGLFVCGDHRDNASIHGAMVSGRRTAEAVLKSSIALSPLGRGNG